MRKLIALIVLVCAAQAADAAKPPRSLAVAVSTDRIEIRRATPGGGVLLIGYELDSQAYSPVYRRFYAERTADGTGSVELDFGRPIVANSFWVAFDLTAGTYGASAHPSRTLREADVPDRALKRNSGGHLEKIEAQLDYVYTLAIRPGVGVWDAITGDGGPSDADGGLDGKIEVAPGRLKKSRKTAGDLGEFREGDIIAIFAPHRMAYLITEVKK